MNDPTKRLSPVMRAHVRRAMNTWTSSFAHVLKTEADLIRILESGRPK